MAPEVSARRAIRLDFLASPIFVFSLSLLVANDFYLKQTYHNWLTGKLSDVAGLVALAVFGCAFFPKRRVAIALSLGVLFAVWKSELSQPLLSFANSYLPYPIGRTVDYTDLVAIPMAWLVCSALPRIQPWPARRWILQGLAAMSIVMFCATSCMHQHVVREVAELPNPSEGTTWNQSELELTAIVDKITAGHGLTCSLCDRLTDGRLYESRDKETVFAVSYDQKGKQLLYDVSSTSWSEISKRRIKEIDDLRNALAKALRVQFPDVIVTVAPPLSYNTIQLGVYRRSLKATAADNEQDSARASRIIEEVALKFGLKRDERWPATYGAGRLLGSSSYQRELVLTFGRASEPLIPIEITCTSARYGELQDVLSRELELRLQAEFGADRAYIRTWFRGSCK